MNQTTKPPRRIGALFIASPLFPAAQSLTDDSAAFLRGLGASLNITTPKTTTAPRAMTPPSGRTGL